MEPGPCASPPPETVSGPEGSSTQGDPASATGRLGSTVGSLSSANRDASSISSITVIGLLVVGPHAKDLDGPDVLQDLVHEAMLQGDPPRERTGQITH